MANSASELATRLGVKFKSAALLTEALTHRSYLNEHPQTPRSNERLEFLGDSVLSVLVSTELYNQYSTYPEGKLTSLRSALVRATMLHQLALKIDLGKYLLLSKGEEKSGGRENPGLLADTFEAVLGAIYLDQGLDAVHTILKNLLFPEIATFNKQLDHLDFKSNLQEAVQDQYHTSPTYKVLTETGPDHAKQFVIGVFVNSQELARGKGKSKQSAEQAAAKAALEKSPTN